MGGWKLRIIAAQETENKTDIEAISNSLQKSSSEEKTKLANGEEKTEETLEFIPIPTEELKKAKDIFGIGTFFVTETIPYQEGAIFKGNLRGDIEKVYTKLSAKLAEKLGDRYRLFLLESPEAKPVVILLPSKNDPLVTTTSQKILAVVLFLATIATSFEAGGLLLGFDFFKELIRYQEALPIVIGLWIVLGGHEIAHQVLAK